MSGSAAACAASPCLPHDYIGLLGWKLRTRLSVSTKPLPEYKVPGTNRDPIIRPDIQCATACDTALNPHLPVHSCAQAYHAIPL